MASAAKVLRAIRMGMVHSIGLKPNHEEHEEHEAKAIHVLDDLRDLRELRS